MINILSRLHLFWLMPLSAAAIVAVAANARGMGLDFGGGGGKGTPVPTLTFSPGPLASPVRIDLGSGARGKLLVTDYAQRAVYRINRDDPAVVEKLFAIQGQPLGIAQVNASLILVGNQTRGVAELYTTRGRLLQSYRAPATMVPTDLAVDLVRQRLFVADSAAGNVKVFSLSGRFLQTIKDPGELFHPMGLAIDPQSRRVVVTDFGDPQTGAEASVQIFGYDGDRLLKIQGDFSSPRGAALAGNRLFVVDALLGQVLVFDATTGARLGSVGSYGTGPGQLLLPLDIAWDGDSRQLYVTNNRLGRVTALASGF